MKIRTIFSLPLLLLASALQAEQPQLEALEAWADTDTGLLMIAGRNFNNGNVLEIQIAGRLPVEVVDPLADYIEVPLPPDLEPGTHTIFITTGGGTIRFDEIDFTYGAVGPQGIQGETGPTGPAGPTGPQGPQGPQGPVGPLGPPGTPGANCFDGIGTTTADCIGPQGEQGPQGDPGNLALAGLSCPEGQFMTGFDGSGGLICHSITPAPGEERVAQPALAQSFSSAINGLIGNELDLPAPITANASAFTIAWTPTLGGFALCQPPDLNAAPASSPPIYGCESGAIIEVFSNPTGSEITLTAEIPSVFYDFAGDWTTNFTTPASGSGEGFLLFNNVVFTATAALVDADGGLKTIGAITQSSFNYDGDLFEIDFGNAELNVLANTLGGLLFTTLTESFDAVLSQIVEQNSATIPPFAIEQ